MAFVFIQFSILITKNLCECTELIARRGYLNYEKKFLRINWHYIYDCLRMILRLYISFEEIGKILTHPIMLPYKTNKE